MTSQENNMPYPENNMPGDFKDRFYNGRGELSFRSDPPFIAKIQLPLGTSYTSGATSVIHANTEVVIGILGELEKLIFDLKDRVAAIEKAQEISAERIEKSLDNIERAILSLGFDEILKQIDNKEV